MDHQDKYPSPPSSYMFEVSSSSTANSTGIGMKRANEKEGNSGGIKVDKFQYSSGIKGGIVFCLKKILVLLVFSVSYAQVFILLMI